MVLVNFATKCSSSGAQTVTFAISPNTGHEGVEVCVLPVFRNSTTKYTPDEIKDLGRCTTEADKNHQYILSFDLLPDLYTALITARKDYSPVVIPALSALHVEDHYEFQFSMPSCDNTISFVTSDSYSITIANSYVWASTTAPRIFIYYTDDLTLSLADINKFNKSSFEGMSYVANQQFTIPNLKPNTTYQFYGFVEPTGNDVSFIQRMISNQIFARTYDVCSDELWPTVGVGSESKIECTIGYHAYRCSKLEDYKAGFTTRNDNCFCKEETVDGVHYNQTAYNSTYEGRLCGWQGVWESVTHVQCEAEGAWPTTPEGRFAVKKCDNDGQLIRWCMNGQWQDVEDQQCGCASRELDEVTWTAANRDESVIHYCGIGNMTRYCNEWGHWDEYEDYGCYCETDGKWSSRPRNTTQYSQCGTGGVEGNVETRRCKNDGFWDEVNYEGCLCQNVTENEITWPTTPMNEAAWIQCEEGSKARLCGDGGFWDSNIADYNCACKEDMGWPKTPANQTEFLPCPDNIRGSQTRRCRNDGVWEDINSIGCYGSCPAYGRFSVTLSGTTGEVKCEHGGGRILMDCLRKLDANGDYYGEWDFDSWRVEGTCQCANDDDVFPTTDVSTDAIVECDSGSRTRTCGKFTARWEAPVDHNCRCTVLDAPFEMELTPIYEETVVKCGAGERRVYCTPKGHYENRDTSNCFCAEEGKYEQTVVDGRVDADCAEKGREHRKCLSSGFWDTPDYSKCQCTGIPELTGSMNPLTTFIHNCSIGMYNIECDARGQTQFIERTCACPAQDGLAQTPAGESDRQQCGIHWKIGVCTIEGVWNITDDCNCPATDEFPKIQFGERADAYIPKCYKGYCNALTGKTEIDYSDCGCAGIDEWPTMKHNDTISLPCETGGWRTAHCSMGVLSVDYEECGCTDTENRNVAVGDYQRFDCMMGFVLKQCRGNNFWYLITDSYCGCASQEEDLKPFEFMLANTTKTVDCGSGSMTIACDGTGHFIRESLVNQCKCPAENLWPETDALGVANIPCASSSDQTQRTCGPYGEWGITTRICNCQGDGEWETSAPGIHSKTCPSGSVIQRTCNDDGTWSQATGSCLDDSCPADGVFPLTAHLGSYTHTCGNGVQITRTCTAGVWSRVDWSQCGCANDDGFVGGEFMDPDLYSFFVPQACSVGERLRECRYGVWQEVDYRNCYCPTMGPLPQTQALKNATRSCSLGMMSAECLKNGTWSIVYDDCKCETDRITVDDVEFTSTPHGESIQIPCSSGSMERRCGDDGTWERVNYNNCKCVAEGWTDAFPTEVGHMNCEEGSVTRMCKPNGQWGAISSDGCSCAANMLFPRTVVEQNATHLCDEGYLIAICTLKGWGEVHSYGCSCGAYDGYPVTPSNTSASIPCGALQVGNKTRFCLESGVWESEEDESGCRNYCPALDGWEATEPGTNAELPCPPGSDNGNIIRHCNDLGLWDQGVSTCVPLRCPADSGFPITSVNDTATLPCPSGEIGSISRRCILENENAVWAPIENKCSPALCVLAGQNYTHNELVVRACEEGEIGEREMRCDTGEWVDVLNTCSPVQCPSDNENGYPSGEYGDTYNVNCGVDYSGMKVMRCNAFQEWEHVSGTCVPITPTLRCEPADGATNIPLSAQDQEQYTVYCTSNVRVKEVVNDELEHMNIHIVFETPTTTLSYPTSAVLISDYTVAFLFEGSFPPSSEGTLYINSGSFVSYTGIQYPANTMIQSFTTCEGTPLSPSPILDSSITIQSVNYVERTATLKLTLPFDTMFYDKGEIAFIGSNLHSVIFTSDTVIVEGAILNSVIPMTWRVGRGDYWSDFASFSVYRPVVLLPPSRPVVSGFNAQQVTWTWSEAELFGHVFKHYTVSLEADGEEILTETVYTNEFQKELEPDKVYSLRVLVCVESDICSNFSEPSEGHLVSSITVSPSPPRDPEVVPIHSTSLDVTWKEPLNTGGSMILSYHIRRSSQEDMQMIYAVYETSEPVLHLTDVTSPVYLEISAFNGHYTSAPLKFHVDPQPLQAHWTSNQDEDVLLDNAIILKGQFTYLSVATCSVSDPSHSSFSQTLSFAPSNAVETIVQPLAPNTTYYFTCEVREIGSEAVALSEFTVTTAVELVPVLVVDGEPTSSLTVSVNVTTNLLGRLTCFVAPYQGLESRPTSLTFFASNWVQSVEVTPMESPIELLFAVDVTGAVLDASETYHAWCVIQREVLEYEDDVSIITTESFPEYSSPRHLLSADSFEVTVIAPVEFASDVDPNAPIRLSFSLPAQVSEGAVTLLSGDNELILVPSDQIHCLQTTCEIRLKGGLQSNQSYVLNVDTNAFVNGSTPLEKEVSNYYFETGFQRCDTKFVSKGLWNTKMCECFSVEGRCECECGETSVMRTL